MKTPEEIKLALDACTKRQPLSCNACAYSRLRKCVEELTHDALEYIRQLEAERMKMAKIVRCKDCLNGWPLPDGAKPFVRNDCLVCAMGRGDSRGRYSVVLPDDYCNAGIKAEEGDKE